MPEDREIADAARICQLIEPLFCGVGGGGGGGGN